MADHKFVYRLMTRADWASVSGEKRIPWAAVDRDDGYFHLSTAAQAMETARLYYADVEDLVALAFDPDALGSDLKYEASRGGDLFPHYYGAIAARLVSAVYTVTRLPSGEYRMETSS